MFSKKEFRFKGLNKRDSVLIRNPEYADDCRNVLLNSKRELIKRYGYDLDISTSGILDVIEYKSGNKLIFIKSDGIYEDISGTLTKVAYGGDSIVYSGLVDYDEYSDVLYISDNSETNNLFKYDGTNFYRAGLPAPDVTAVNGAGGLGTSYYFRVFYAFVDHKFNVIFGDYHQTTTAVDSASIDINTLIGEEYYTLNGGAIISPFIMVARSENLTYGYEFVEYGVSVYGLEVNPTKTIDHTSATSNIPVNAPTSVNVPLEDYYDSTILRGLPPKAKYFKIYGATAVMANKALTGTIREPNSRSSIYWSDTAVGASVENFPPFNRQEVGKSSEGDINGLFASDNELIILKQFQLYYIHGILIDRAFRLTSAVSGGIGCESFKSIIEVDGGCLFQASRGIYFAGGGSKPAEISDLIEPLFTEDTTGLDFSKTRATRDTRRERVLFFIPATNNSDDLVFVFDYYHKEWFLFGNYNADNGFIFYSNKLYHSDGSSVFEESTSYNDNGVAIDAYYQSTFHHFGIPGLVKKFVRAIIYSIGNSGWTCNLRTKRDWKSSHEATDTNTDINFTPSLIIEDKVINKVKAKSMSFVIRNSLMNEGMLVNGYEIEYQNNQVTVKGDS